MADLKEQDKPKVAISKTPQGQIVVEAPVVSSPAMQFNPFGYYGTWLGNPYERYGYLVSAQHVPMNTKLEMMKDELLALCIAFTGATLVKATREIHCADEKKRRFFEALFRSWEQEFILQANVGIALGSLGLVKNWRFVTPESVITDAPPVWDRSATPYVITGFDMLYPIGSEPKFDAQGKAFEGMYTPDGEIDVFYSLWLTFRQELAFGAYKGVGRLEHCYKQWWLKNFATDLYVVALQKEANRVVESRYPPGKNPKSAKSNQTIALEIGDKVRSGATVAMPSDVYETIGLDGEARMSTIQKWALKFLEGSGNMGNFNDLDDHHDKKMALGYYLPPQAIMDVTGGDLGGPTSADRLAGMAEEFIMQDAADIDRQLNKYVFPPISRANFPSTSPKVIVKTVGLSSKFQTALIEIIKALVTQHPDAKFFDMRAAMERLEFPLKSEGQLEKEVAQSSNTSPQTPAPEAPAAIGAAIDDEGKVQVQGKPLKPWPDDEDVSIDDDDIDVAVDWWRDFAPVGAKGLLDAETIDEEDNA